MTGITPTLLGIDPSWDPIRNDPRFQELVTEKNRDSAKSRPLAAS
jgi:hypothetical protein